MHRDGIRRKNWSGRAPGGILLTLTAVLFLTSCAGKSGPAASGSSESAAGSSAADMVKDADLVIPAADITEKAGFYPVEIDGTRMEVIAVKAPDGTIRTAFNTCQVCYDSGRGYYRQSGGRLVCQNCGNQFDMSHVEVEAGGCNPWPISEPDKNVTEDSITVPYEFLKESRDIFADWKQ